MADARKLQSVREKGPKATDIRGLRRKKGGMRDRRCGQEISGLTQGSVRAKGLLAIAL
ncbi:hypothetical protein Trydic_g12733, partial [Trypoxylus dichotomus]